MQVNGFCSVNPIDGYLKTNNYFSEFKTEQQKAIARANLGIQSMSSVDFNITINPVSDSYYRLISQPNGSAIYNMKVNDKSYIFSFTGDKFNYLAGTGIDFLYYNPNDNLSSSTRMVYIKAKANERLNVSIGVDFCSFDKGGIVPYGTIDETAYCLEKGDVKGNRTNRLYVNETWQFYPHVINPNAAHITITAEDIVDGMKQININGETTDFVIDGEAFDDTFYFTLTYVDSKIFNYDSTYKFSFVRDIPRFRIINFIDFLDVDKNSVITAHTLDYEVNNIVSYVTKPEIKGTGNTSVSYKDGYVEITTPEFNVETDDVSITGDGTDANPLKIVEDVILVSLSINGKFYLSSDNDKASVTTVEDGAIVSFEGTWKWTHDNTKKDPTSTYGEWGTTLTASNVNSESITVNNITSTRTISQSISSPKSGLIVENGKVVTARGNDTNTSGKTINIYGRVFYGLVTTETITEAVIESLGSSLKPSKINDYTNSTVSGTQYVLYCYPKSYGALTGIFAEGNPVNQLDAFVREELTITNIYNKSIDVYYYISNPGVFNNVKLNFK